MHNRKIPYFLPIFYALIDGNVNFHVSKMSKLSFMGGPPNLVCRIKIYTLFPKAILVDSLNGVLHKIAIFLIGSKVSFRIVISRFDHILA